MKIFYKAFTIILLFLFLIGCNSESDDTTNETETTESAVVQTEIFKANGRIVSIPPSKRNFIVRHGDIPGFMNAMTMAFSVRDTAMLRQVEPGDSIRFEIESQGSSAVVISLNLIEE